MYGTALVTVTHDPDGKNLKLLQELQEKLKSIYSELFITVSEESSNSLINVLKKSNFKTKIIPKLGSAHARRQAVNLGLSGESQYFHYGDFDRILIWAKHHPVELRETVKFDT